MGSKGERPNVHPIVFNCKPQLIPIWPPKPYRRQASIDYVFRYLAPPSFTSKRYCSLSHDEASSAARAIEEEAFAAATAFAAVKAPAATPSETMRRPLIDEDQDEIFQFYVREIGKRMREKEKANPPVAAAAETSEDVSPGFTPHQKFGTMGSKGIMEAALERFLLENPNVHPIVFNCKPQLIPIWPLKPHRRQVSIDYVFGYLAPPSFTSKRYCSLSHDEASSAARAIEEEAFAAATAFAAAKAPAATQSETMTRPLINEDQDEIFQFYMREIGKRMMEKEKAKPPVAAAADPGTSEDVSLGESETS
ncbi:hypothetical protein Sjap_022504 [Stephania japonica]|uniref:WPP domain-containing protein n=1 Tax=Stephania japonica TaxID=461633 RepID=A0AAP0EUD9_9MAGN